MEENLNTQVIENYDESQIQVLEGLEAVRKRPGMYIGSTGPRGLHHLVYEIVDNAIDEALAGYCDHIEVDILPGNAIRVADNGRGIPVGIQPKMGISAATVVFTVLHAGGKFGGGGYKVSGGLHGVGASVVNALSQWLKLEVHDGTHKHFQSFTKGVPDEVLKEVGTTDHTGTIVTFQPDPDIFEELTYDYNTLLTRLREQSFLNAGIKVTLTDRRPEGERPEGQPTQEVLQYEGGIRSFVEFEIKRRHLETLHPDPVYISGQLGTSTAE
ncbi:MAG: DNA topoisomerase IV subunit B, partial [Oscillospiraceae bacterium]|nr:DNA topoisomerase IV subunit B [Oscillospiraceae bacterium]